MLFERDIPASRPLTPALPASELQYADISESPSDCDGLEFLPAVAHGDRPWGARRGVAVPSAHSSDDPTGPGKAMTGVGVLLFFGFALDRAVQPVERVELGLRKGDARRLGAAVAD